MKNLLLSTLLLSISLSAFTQDYWEHVHTNDTTTIWTVKIANDGTIYYGGGGGLFISYDDGLSWECKNILFYLAIYTIEFDLDSNSRAILQKNVAYGFTELCRTWLQAPAFENLAGQAMIAETCSRYDLYFRWAREGAALSGPPTAV